MNEIAINMFHFDLILYTLLFNNICILLKNINSLINIIDNIIKYYWAQCIIVTQCSSVFLQLREKHLREGFCEFFNHKPAQMNAILNFIS